MSSFAFASSGNAYVSLWSNVIVFAVFIFAAYFFLFRPQQKKIDDHQVLIKSLKIGDEIITIGGVIGKVSSIGDTDLEISVSDSVNVRIAKYAVSELLNRKEKEKKVKSTKSVSLKKGKSGK